MKRILITGANSYIGTSFEKYIADKTDDYTVDTVDMFGDGWKEKDFSAYDAVFHVAGIAHSDSGKISEEKAKLYYSVNTDLTIETAKKAKADGVKQFIFMSSIIVYGISDGHITSETQPQPKNCYGKSKLLAENSILELNDDSFNVAILRPPMIYGQGCKGNYNELRRLALKLPVFPYVKNQRSMLYIENLCAFIKQVVDSNSSGIMFPQNSEYVNTSDMAKCIGKFSTKRVRLIKGFGWLIKFCSLFVGKLRKAFGSLTYDKSMSGDLASYNVCDFAASIALTEIGR